MRTLQDKIDEHGGAEPMLRANPGGRFQFPIAPEFTNWQDEQRAWRETVVLQDMSFHMTVVHIEGPDAIAFISHLGANNFESFGPNQAKQLVMCNGEGHLVGDAIITCASPTSVSVIGRPEGAGWVQYHAAAGDFDVAVRLLETPSPNIKDRETYRYQVQGPNAGPLLEALNGGPLPDIKFFRMGEFGIGSHRTLALNHRMSGEAGFELIGPSEEAESVKAQIMEAGQDLGIRQLGGRVYPTTAMESGWLGGPVSAIYSGSSTADYRSHVSAASFQANVSLGGSFQADSIDDLYVRPWDIGYGFLVHLDHDFIGRDALAELSTGPKRKKVRLLWNAEDVLSISASMLSDGPAHKFMEAPAASYATYCFDEVTNGSDRIGMSYYPVYSANVGSWFSLAMIDEQHATDGAAHTLTWGDLLGGASRDAVEAHTPATVRVTVDAKPKRRA